MQNRQIEDTARTDPSDPTFAPSNEAKENQLVHHQNQPLPSLCYSILKNTYTNPTPVYSTKGRIMSSIMQNLRKNRPIRFM